MGRRIITIPRCSICGLVKDASEFGKCRIKKNGLTSRCRECMRSQSRERYAAKKSSRPVRARNQHFRGRTKDGMRWQIRRYEFHTKRYRSKSQIAANKAIRFGVRRFEIALRAALKELIPVVFRRSCSNASCTRAARRGDHRCLECDRIRKGQTPRGLYLASIPTSYGKTVKARRQARKRSGFVEPVYRKEIWQRDAGRCWICKRKVTFEEMTLDHVLPLAIGGEHSRANCRPAHRLCNSKKRDLRVTLF